MARPAEMKAVFRCRERDGAPGCSVRGRESRMTVSLPDPPLVAQLEAIRGPAAPTRRFSAGARYGETSQPVVNRKSSSRSNSYPLEVAVLSPADAMGEAAAGHHSRGLFSC